MQLRAQSGLGVVVEQDGELVLYWPDGAQAFCCGTQGTAAWIALQQSEWQPEDAAEKLAATSEMDVAECRENIVEWQARFQRAGLLTEQ